MNNPSPTGRNILEAAAGGWRRLLQSKATILLIERGLLERRREWVRTTEKGLRYVKEKNEPGISKFRKGT